jgi:hypothetical protein
VPKLDVRPHEPEREGATPSPATTSRSPRPHTGLAVW